MILYASDAQNANSSGGLDSLIADAASAKALEAALDSFIGESPSQLKGQVWDNIRANFTAYKEICAKRAKVANDLYEAIREGNQVLIDYMNSGGEDKADTDEIPKLEAEISRLKSLMYNETSKKDDKSSRPDYSSEIAELERKKDWLKRLPSADGSASGCVSGFTSINFVENGIK